MNKEKVTEKADKIWSEFRNLILYKNRFFVKHKIFDIIQDYATKQNVEIQIGTTFYRARIIDDNAQKDHRIAQWIQKMDSTSNEYDLKNRDNDFHGLSKEGSFVPPNSDNIKIKDGRANPKFIKYLYVSEEAATAIFEVRPLIFNRVNVAVIKTIQVLNIVDLSIDFCPDRALDTVENLLLSYVGSIFAIPTNDSDDYIPTQIISEYIKHLGFDGIKFRSSLHKGGINYAIFNYDKCEAINSRDFKIEDLKVTARSTTPIGKDEFWHIKDNKRIVRPPNGNYSIREYYELD